MIKRSRGQPKKDSVRKMVSIRMHPAITEQMNSTIAPMKRSRFIEQAICDKLGVCHADIIKIVDKSIDV